MILLDSRLEDVIGVVVVDVPNKYAFARYVLAYNPEPEDQDTTALVFAGETVVIMGAVGTGLTVMEADATDGLDTVPFSFVPVIVKVYVVPFVNPLNVIGLVVPVAVAPPGDAVMV
jgi:hypothetical protein